MFSIKQPAMALNDSAIGAKYQMWNTWDVKKHHSKEHIINWVATVASGYKRGAKKRLENVVINCHGMPGAFKLGKDWFKRKNKHLFYRWRNKVKRIWILSCRPAETIIPGKSHDGNLFMSEIARAANCYVIASPEKQVHRSITFPFGKLDAFEGKLLVYGPKGNIVWSKTYISKWRKVRNKKGELINAPIR